MNRYFFCQRNDKSYNKIGFTYALNRKQAAILFAVRKGLKVKDFLNIFSVYNVPSNTVKFPCFRIKISYTDDRGEMNSIQYFIDEKTRNWKAAPVGRLERKCFNMFKTSYSLNKMIQFLNFLEKENNYKIYYDDYDFK